MVYDAKVIEEQMRTLVSYKYSGKYNESVINAQIRGTLSHEFCRGYNEGYKLGYEHKISDFNARIEKIKEELYIILDAYRYTRD